MGASRWEDDPKRAAVIGVPDELRGLLDEDGEPIDVDWEDTWSPEEIATFRELLGDDDIDSEATT